MDKPLPKVTAIITARGGSKGVPRKNVRDVAGKPLISYTIKAALHCPLIEACYVTSEDPEIQRVSQFYGAQVIERPEHLAQDSSLSQDAVHHAIEEITRQGAMTEFFVLLQPTSPLRNHTHLENCLRAFFKSGSTCCVSVTEAEHHPWKMILDGKQGAQPVHSVESLEQPRQNLPKAYRINGAIYVMQTKLFLDKRRFFVAPVYPFVMDNQSSLDIDTEQDLQRVSTILSKSFS